MNHVYEILPLAARDDLRVIPDYDSMCSALSETAAMRVAGKIVADGAAIGVVGANVSTAAQRWRPTAGLLVGKDSLYRQASWFGLAIIALWVVEDKEL